MKGVDHMLNIGEKAPDFKMDAISSFSSLPSPVSLEDYRGKWLILFFYPFDFSIVCPTEIRSLNERLPEFEALDAKILAISTDSIYSHKAWLKSSDSNGIGEMKFPLGSDYKKTAAAVYDVLNQENGAAQRATYIIDPEGVIKYAVMTHSHVGRSASETLRVLQALQSGGMCPMDWKAGEKTLEV